MEVFGRWKTARACVHQAVQSLLDASIQLHSATAHGSLFHSRSAELEDLAQKIQDELADDDMIETKLAESRAMANRARNMSAIRSPVNMLPTEILSRIFLFTVSSNVYCALQGKQDPTRVVSSICGRWRQIAVTTCSLWSHIHLRPALGDSDDQENLFKTTELWVKRADLIPLHLHFLPNRNTGASLRLLPWHVSILRSHFGLVSSIEISETTQHIIHSSLAAVSQTGTPSTLKYLNVALKNGTVVDRLPWPVERLHGLVDLQLTRLYSDTSPSFDELMCILGSSPSLQTLRLTSVLMNPGTPVAVHLPALKLLDVTYLDSTILIMLLSAITLGDAELDLRVTFDMVDHKVAPTLDALVQFNARSNVVSLCLSNIYFRSHLPLRKLISSVPLLRILVVKDTCNSFRLLKHLFDPGQDKPAVQLPKVHTLILSGRNRLAEPESQVLRFVDAYPFHTVVRDGCEGEDPLLGHYVETEDIGALEIKFRAELAKRVRSVQVTDDLFERDIRRLDLYVRRLIQEGKDCIL